MSDQSSQSGDHQPVRPGQRKEDVAPELHVYGNINKLTAGFGQQGMMDGGGGGMQFKSLIGGGSISSLFFW